MISAVIVEDEPLARLYLRQVLEATGRVKVVEELEDGASGLASCARLRPDVAFLDIEMPGPDGLALAGSLLRLPRPPLVVFVTGFAGHAIDAFRVEAVDFVLKPFEPEQIRETVRRLEHRLASRSEPQVDGDERERIQVRNPDGGALLLIPRRSIVAVIRSRRRTWIHTASAAYPSHEALSRVGLQLKGDPFLQISRDAIVNFDEVYEIRRLGDRHFEVVLQDSFRTRVETSRSGAAVLTEKLRQS